MNLEIHHNGDDWAALYVDGKLDRVGDAYLADERVRELLGVTYVVDDSFMRGQTSRDGVAKTLDEVEEYRTARQLAIQEAERLREEAAALIAKADELSRP